MSDNPDPRRTGLPRPGPVAWDTVFPARLAWVPAPTLLSAILILWLADWRTSYESPYVLMGLNFVFSVLASLAVAFLLGKSFLNQARPGLLLVGCGALVWGMAGFVGSVVTLIHGTAGFSPNLLVTIHNTCVWVSALCHLLGAAFSLRWRASLSSPRLWLALSYGMAFGLVGIVTLAALRNWMPVFFIDGQGGTLLRQFVLGSAIAMFALAVLMLRAMNQPRWSKFAYWYALGLVLLAVGLAGVMLQPVAGSLLGWTGRAAQFLGGAYMLGAALVSVRDWGNQDIRLGRAVGETRHCYAVAIALVAAAAIVRLVFLQALGTKVSFITFYPAVMAAALYGGLRAGLLAAVLAVLLADYFWIEPAGTFSIAHPADWLAIGVFLLSCTMISTITEAMHRAQIRALRAEAQAKSSFDPALAGQIFEQRERRRSYEQLKAVFPVNLVFPVALAMLALLAFFAYQNISAMLEFSQREEQTYELVHGLNQLRSTLAEARSSTNAYLATGDEKYLGIKANAAEQVSLKLGNLLHLAENNPRQYQSLLPLAAPIRQNLAELEQAIAVRQTQGFAAAQQSLAGNSGWERSEAIRALMDQFQANELNVLRERDKEQVDKTHKAIRSGGLGVLFNMALLSLVFLALRREIAERVEAEGELARHRDRLEILAQERTADLRQEIAAHREAEQALHDNEERLRLVLQASSMGTFEIDLSSGAGAWNPVEFELLGLHPGETPSNPETFFRFVHPADQARVSAQWEEAVRTGQLDTEFRIVRTDGEVRWLAGKGRLTCMGMAADSGPLRFVGINFDITKRKRAEERLLRSEAALAKAQTIANLGSWEWDLLTGEVRWSDQMYRIFDVEPRAWLASYDGFLARVHPEDRKRVDDLIHVAIAHGKPISLEYRVPSRQGAVRTILAHAEVDLTDDGSISRVLGTCLDISERKHMEQALLASEHFKQGVLDSLPAHVAVLDNEGTILAVNRPWLRFAAENGNPTAEGVAAGANYLEVCRRAASNGEPVAQTVLQGMEAVLAGSMPRFELEYPCVLPTEKRWFVIHILKPSADIGGAIVTHLDITERKLAEQALHETQRQNAFLANLLENSSQSFGMGYPDGRVGSTNKAFQALIGYNEEELRVVDWVNGLTPAEWREAEIEKLHELELTGRPVRYEKEYLRKDGSRVPVELLVNVMKDAAGKTEYFYAFITDISERKRGENALRQERLFLRQVIDAVPSLIFVKDREGRILLCNEAFARDYGRSVDDLVGKRNDEFNRQEEEVEQFCRDDREVIETGQAKVILEEKVTHADGTVHWYNTVKLPMRNALGVYDHVLGVATDITPRKQAEKALRESQADLNRAQAMAHIGSWRLDVLHNVLSWSDENYRIFGIPEGTPLSYETFLSTIHPEDRDFVDRAWNAGLAGQPYDIEHRIIMGETVKWLRERAELEFDEDGILLGGFGTTQDISELKSSQQALQQERGFLRQVLDATPSLIFVKDREGRFLLANEALARGYGTDTTAIVGKSDADFNPHRDEVANFLRDDQEVLESRMPKLIPLERVSLANNEVHWFSTVKIPLPEPDGRVEKLLGVATDITDRKRAEDALKEADRRKDEFLAMLAHELRNPLTPIMVAAQMLQKRGAEDPSLVKWAGDTVKRQCENLTQLVNQLLDVSRVTKGKITLRKEAKDLRELLDNTVESCRHLIGQHHHELIIATSPEAMMAEVDAVRIEQAVGNLLNNAAKYTPNGGKIWLSLERDGDVAVIRVRDNGIGISASMLPGVFDLFVQAERTLDRAQGGLGIGLALVKSLVEMHGGSVKASSEGIGAGSEFEVRLPLLARDSGLGETSPAALAQPPVKARRILVVDDNQDVRVSMAMLLRAMGHAVWEAENGQEALEALKLTRLDAVLLDIGMPGLNGYEVARLIREDPARASLCLIAMTGYSQEYDRQASFKAGFNHHLVKPFDPVELNKLLADVD